MACLSSICPSHYECPHCDFTSSSKSGVGVHSVKAHPIDDSMVDSVSVVRLYPEGKKFHCCLCGNVISSFPNFKRYFDKIHKNVSLISSGHCSICKKDFQTAKGVGVHCRTQHNISKTKASLHALITPTPIASVPKFRRIHNNHDPVQSLVTPVTSPSVITDATSS